MSRWTIDETATLEFDGVVALKAMLLAGNISVLATDDKPSILVSEVTGPPLLISHEAGMLSVAHERIWDSVVSWLRTQDSHASITVMVPRDCPVHVNLASADAILTGLTVRTSIKSASGDVTLDGVTGKVDATTVSGLIEAQGLEGEVSFGSVSGDLTLAGGTLDRLTARTVSGKVTADIALVPGHRVAVQTISGEVALRVPASVSAQVTLNSAAGRVDTAFTELTRTDRAVGKSAGGTLGTGAGRLSVNTVSGPVTLLSRPDANGGGHESADDDHPPGNPIHPTYPSTGSGEAPERNDGDGDEHGDNGGRAGSGGDTTTGEDSK
jgi:putative adhesin